MNLAQARAKTNKSRKEVAAYLDCHESFIWHLERGNKGASLEVALKLKELFPKLDLATLTKTGKEVA